MEIVVIDDNIKTEDPLIVELGMEYEDENIKLFTKPDDGLDYIKENLVKKIIVILDINLGQGEKTGHQVLSEIREHDKLIPVIIWSAKDGSNDDFTDFINNHALFYVKQTGTTEEIINRVKDATHRLNLDVATAIENWLEKQENKDQTIMVSGESKPLTVNDLIKEIRLETEKGQKIEESILRLTISLLVRGKESI